MTDDPTMKRCPRRDIGYDHDDWACRICDNENVVPMDTDELEMKLREKAEYLDFYCDQWWGGQVAYYKDEERVVIFQRNGRTLKELLQNLVKEVFDA